MTDRVDMVIIGGGVLGLSLAYQLARRGGTSVAVLEKTVSEGRFTVVYMGNDAEISDMFRFYRHALPKILGVKITKNSYKVNVFHRFGIGMM